MQLIGSLRSIATFDTAALFVPAETADEVEALFVEGPGAPHLRRTRIPIGEQLTGWVVAHQTSVWNSDAALDLAASVSRTGLVSASSMPLVYDDHVLGALTLYGQQGQEITVEQRRSLESLLPTISSTLTDALHRPAIAIDCRQQHIRDAALAAMDSLLSHNRQQATQPVGATLAISIDAASHEVPRVQLSLDSAIRTLAALLSPRATDNRCVLRIASGQLFVCALDGASAEALATEVKVAQKHRHMQTLVITTAPVYTSLELHDRVRRMTETATSKPLSGVRGGK